MNEKFEFVVKTQGAKRFVVVEARNKGDAILKLESQIGGMSLGDFYLARRTVDGQKRWV